MKEYLPHIVTILYLIVIEGLLSFDNALALAALVKKRLPNPVDQKHALTWGIWGAYIFRTIVIFAGVWLMQHDWIKVAAGAYLIFLAIKELWPYGPSTDSDASDSFGLSWLPRFSPLVSTIVAVELMDVMFSVDSIGVALAVSDVRWVLIVGAFLGILTMRVAAGVFIKLIARFPRLEKTAFVMVGLAGVNVILKVFHYELNEYLFLGLMGSIFLGTLLVSKPVKEVSHVQS